MGESKAEMISRKAGLKPTACKCKQCRGACVITPCLGTPQDILKLAQSGYADVLKGTIWGNGIATKLIDHVIDMIQLPRQPGGGPCVMFDENGMCRLHDTGMKPTEGKLAHHTMNTQNYFVPGKSLTYLIAKEWENPENKAIIDKIRELTGIDPSPEEKLNQAAEASRHYQLEAIKKK